MQRSLKSAPFLVGLLLLLAPVLSSASLTNSGGPLAIAQPVLDCNDRRMVVATESLVAIQNTECLDELEVEMASMASTNATWLYASTPQNACTLLWWHHGPSLDFFAAPCFSDQRAINPASNLPCGSLALIGDVRLDLCGPDALTNSNAQDSSQSNILECLGPITATEAEQTEASPLEDCVDAILNDPTVGNVIECVNQIVGPSDEDQANLVTCPSVDDLCPSPILDLDAMVICGIGLCERSPGCEIPQLCDVDNGIGVQPNCIPHPEVCNDGIGVEPACIPLPSVGFCEAPDAGIIVDDFPVCLTVTICPSPEFGIRVNGIGYCQAPILLCDPPAIGVQPDCTDPAQYICNEDEVGVRPICTPMPRLCSSPTYGVEPLCYQPCSLPEFGVEPSCVKLCSAPTVGVDPDCTNPDEFKCDIGEQGIEPVCVDPKDYECEGEGEVGLEPACYAPVFCELPEVGLEPTCVDANEFVCPVPTIGVPPTCFDGVDVLFQAIGIVLGALENQGCRTGTMPYQNSDGEWCASHVEIAMDAIPDREIPGITDDTPEDNPMTIAFEASHSLATPLEEGAVPIFAPLSGGTPEDEPDCSVTCKVVLIRGYDFHDDGSGYGIYTELEAYLIDHGYEVKKIDIYNDCLNGAVQMDGEGYGAHSYHFPTGHGSGNSCASKTHTLDNYIYHMGFHLAWSLHTLYGAEAFDVVAHSMGGLLVRYAIHKAGSGDPDFPLAKLNAEDVVSVATPHGGLCCSWTVGATNQKKQMDEDSKTMHYLKANAQNPQGLAATAWTLMSADADVVVQEETAMGMTASHKLWYTQNWGGDEDASYNHNDFFSDDILTLDADYKWKSGDGAWFTSNTGPHSVRRIYWGVVSSAH